MKIQLPWSAHCRFAHEKFFRYNKMLALATEESFSLFLGQNRLMSISWAEVEDIVVEPSSSKTVVSIKLANENSINLVFSNRNWLGLSTPEMAIDAGNELRWVKHQLDYA